MKIDWAIDFPAKMTPTMKLSSDKLEVALVSIAFSFKVFKNNPFLLSDSLRTPFLEELEISKVYPHVPDCIFGRVVE